jgi:hypothetical protein
MNWYKLASINPWSVFDHVVYDKETNQYKNIVISKDRLNGFIHSLSDNEVRTTYVNVTSHDQPGLSNVLEIGICMNAASLVLSEDLDVGDVAVDKNIEKIERHSKLIVDGFNSLGGSMLRTNMWRDLSNAVPNFFDCKLQCQFHSGVILDD